MLQEVADGLPQSGVRLDAVFVELRRQPHVELDEAGRAVGLVPLESSLRREALRASLGIDLVHGAERLEHVPTFGRKCRRDVHESPPGMGETIADDRLERGREGGEIPRQRVTHLNRRRQRGRAVREHRGQVFAGMLAAGEVERDLPAVDRRHDA